MRISSLPHLEHELVLLRPITAADIEPWFLYLSKPEVFEHTSWNVQNPNDLSHYAVTQEDSTPSYELRFAIALRSNNALVGTAGFHTVSAKDNRAEIAYDIAPEYWRRGIGRSVCSQLIDWAHTKAAIIRIQATVLETNLPSAAILERCGFQREGLLRSYRNVRGKPGNFYMYAHVTASADA